MAGLFGSTPKVIPEFTGLQVNTSVQVLPVPIIYGSPRVSINLIYYNGFNSQLVSQGGGKGIVSGGKGAKNVEYFATTIMAIGEGPIGPVKIIYQDQNVWTPANYPTNGAYYYSGTSTQTPWSYVATKWPADERPYKDTAYYAFSNAQLDASATVPQINLVLAGHLTGTSPLNHSVIHVTTGQYKPDGSPMSYIGDIDLGNADADPAQVIYDFLTNQTYGALFPSQYIDTATLFSSSNAYLSNVGDNAVSTFCQAVGLAWSLVLNNVESGNSILDKWCKNMNVAPVWNGAVLRFVPYWDRYSGLNPNWDATNGIAKKYYQPKLTPIVTITLDQILESENKEEDPISFTRKDPMEVYNTIRADYRDRTNFFNDVPTEVKDEVHIELYGPRVDNISSATEYSLKTYADVVATMALRRNISIMRTFTWKLSPLWGWLEPMNVVNIPDPANYNNFIAVRIVSTDDDEEENVTVTAEELAIGSQSPTVIPTATTSPPTQGPLNVPASTAYPPVMFTVPDAMLAATGFVFPQFLLGASGGNGPGYEGVLDPNWGGAYVWASLNGVDYQLIGNITGPSTIGSLVTAIGGYVGPNPDPSGTIVVNLGESDGVLSSVTPVAAAAGHSICALQDASGFEIFAYTIATLTGPYTYTLSGLYRGMYGTPSRHFGVGSNFLYVGDTANVMEVDLPPGYIGVNFWVKLQTFNTMGNYFEDLSDCVAYEATVGSSTPSGPTAPPMQMATYRRQTRGSSITRAGLRSRMKK